MARKKEVIQKEWDAAQENLNKALTAAESAVEKMTLTDKMVEDAQAKYAAWKELLTESISKISAWKNEKDKERLEFMKYVETAKTKSDRNYIAKIKALWTDAAKVLTTIGAQQTLEEVIRQYEHDSLGKLKKVTDSLREAMAAIEKKDADTALKKHGAALNYLKGVTSYATKTGLQFTCGNFAKKYKVTLKDINLNDPTLKKWFEKTVAAYKLLTEKIEELEPAIDKLVEELANKEPETTSSDPEYKKHLKEIQSDYKDVLAFASSGLAKTKKFQGDVTKLVNIAPTATAEVADKVATAAVKIFEGAQKEYRAVDKHIQETVRTSKSTVTVKREKYGISKDDQLKTLGPLMDRIFALNFQAKAAFENSIDDLRDVLEGLVERFDNAAAKRALGQVTM